MLLISMARSVRLLLLLGLSTALSLTRIRQIDQQVDLFELNTLPSVRLLHDLSAGVEDLRGMAALHLVLSGTAEPPFARCQALVHELALAQHARFQRR